MAQVSAAEVKALRERTGAGMMDCKRVLEEAGGDVERAIDLLRERGLAKARGKAGRATSDGRIAARVSEDGRVAALVEVNCETDFVAKTEDFGALCEALVRAVCESNPADVEALLALRSGDGTLEERVSSAIAKLGENIQVRRIARLEAPAGHLHASYIHAGGKIGTLVQVQARDPEAGQRFARDLSLHVAAASPSGITRDDVPAAEVEREREILRRQAQQSGKPPGVVEKMVEGRLGKFFKEVVLLEQPLVMDPDRSVEKAAREAGATVTDFRRFQLGEAS